MYALDSRPDRGLRCAAALVGAAAAAAAAAVGAIACDSEVWVCTSTSLISPSLIVVFVVVSVRGSTGSTRRRPATFNIWREERRG